ncbi:DEAD/DEAH box helicase [Sinanaerobacter sp. ZZT-01]|uniref:DEAD/DEAH box helicase n=1 Tax=Sinanaerobacter sp. ZZT-01 TaxID=3111540 RepID=UPI002D77A9F8|nr:DEAD/DEAH box helicase [Sinanaerobacter sp. ZZT-01]WRR93476.1 DEAD/DEAH box helicase [Sinanaerobacter sp. ZZT-01]
MENLIFENLNLSEDMQRALDEMGFEEATPIQSMAIPHVLSGEDIIGQAQTGTGKTCAFGIPAIEKIDPTLSGTQVLALCPTRELAIQVAEELRHLTKYKKGIQILPIYGGQSIDRQIMALKKKPQIIVGTPGRIMDHMRRRTLKLADLKMIILDEADEMLNMGFREDIDLILQGIPEERQTLLFSATMPKEIKDLAKLYQNNAVHVQAAHKELTVPNIEQYFLEVRESSKLELLCRLIDAKNVELGIVFCNTKRKVDEITASLQARGYSADALHGDMKQSERDRVMNKFRKRLIDILVATDVAARGIDVNNIDAVFNYDIPSDEEYYVHRIGRTGRAGKCGVSYSFVFGREIYKLKDIQRYTKSEILPMKPPTISDVEEVRLSLAAEKVVTALKNGGYSKYTPIIEKILEDTDNMTTLDVASALFQMAFEELESRNYEHSDLDEDPHQSGRGNMVRVFLNVGSMDKIQPKNIVQGIASLSAIPGKLIGSIDIHKNFSFVELPKEHVDDIMHAMRNFTHRGRKVTMEKATKRQRNKKSSGNERRNKKKRY